MVIQRLPLLTAAHTTAMFLLFSSAVWGSPRTFVNKHRFSAILETFQPFIHVFATHTLLSIYFLWRCTHLWACIGMTTFFVTGNVTIQTLHTCLPRTASNSRRKDRTSNIIARVQQSSNSFSAKRLYSACFNFVTISTVRIHIDLTLYI